MKNEINQIVADGGTNIRAGLEAALNLLESNGIIGGQIVLMTDGEDGSDWVNPILPRADQMQVTIHTCAITHDASTKLPELSEKGTGGSHFMISDASDIREFINVMTGLLITVTDGDETKTRVNLISEDVQVTSSENSVPIQFDMGLSEETIVTTFYSKDQISSMSGYMVPPSGKNDPSVNCVDDQRFSKLDCKFTTKPSAGKWTLKITPRMTSSSAASVTVSASSTIPNDLDGTFLVKGYIGKSEIQIDGQEPDKFWDMKRYNLDKSQVIMASVRYSRWAVLNAKVEAVIVNSKGLSIKIPLEDNGAAYNKEEGADLYENDGIYSAKLDSTLEVGTYSVQISVNGNENTFYVRNIFVVVILSF